MTPADLPLPDEAVAAAAALLRALPTQRHRGNAARKLLDRFNRRFPEARAKLVTHTLPASDRVTYDVLLHSDRTAAGVVTLTWSPDQALPWTPQFADHWAANFVLSVNGAQTTLQSALLFLNSVLPDQPSLMEELIERSLLADALAAHPPALSAREVSRAVDRFRKHRGLWRAAETRRWLSETNLTMDALRSLVGHEARLGKFKQALVRNSVGPHFRAQRRNFQRITLLQVSGLGRRAAEKLAVQWRQTRQFPLPKMSARMPGGFSCGWRTVFGCDLPAAFAGQAAGSIVGPWQVAGGLAVAQIQGVRPARLDAATREKIRAVLFREWLQARRRDAVVRWHWM